MLGVQPWECKTARIYLSANNYDYRRALIGSKYVTLRAIERSFPIHCGIWKEQIEALTVDINKHNSKSFDHIVN